MSRTYVRLVLGVAAAMLMAATIVHAQEPTPAQKRPMPLHGSPHERDPAMLFEQGGRALQAGLLSKAEEDFRAVTQLDPRSAAAFVNLGVTLMREKRWGEALVPLRRARQLDPEMAGVHLNLGLVHFQTSNYLEAVPEFRDVLTHTPENPQARYLLGLSCFFTGDYAYAAQTLVPLWSAQSTNLTYLYVLGSAAGRAKLPELEVKALTQMVIVGKGSPEFYLYEGKAMLGKQDYASAVEALQHAIALQPTLPMAHFFLAQALDAEHHEEEARAELETEIQLEPGVAYGYDELGRVCALLGRDAEAQSAYLSAISRDPSLSEAYVGLARLHKQQGHFVEALDAIDHAVALKPSSGSIHYLRAQFLQKLRREPEAQAEFTTSATLLRQFNDTLQDQSHVSRDADAIQIRSAAQL